MSSLRELILRLRVVISERESAIESLRTLLASLENAANSLAPEALELLEKAMNKDGEIERTLEFFETRRKRGPLPPSEIAIAIKAVLLAHNKPMRRGDIVRELEKKGIPLAGRDKNKNLGTIIWRHPNMFVRVRELGYWLKEIEIPGVYTPEE